MNIKKLVLIFLGMTLATSLHAQLKITDKMKAEFSCYGVECRNFSHAEKEDLVRLIINTVRTQEVGSDLVLLPKPILGGDVGTHEDELKYRPTKTVRPIVEIPVRLYGEDYEYLKIGAIPLQENTLELERSEKFMAFRYKPNKNYYSSANVMMDKSILPNTPPRAMFSTIGIGRMIQGGTVVEIAMLKSIANMQMNGFNPKPDGFYLQIRKKLK